METKKIYFIVMLLMLLLVDEYMMGSEATTCYKKSRKFRSKCHRSSFFRKSDNNSVCKAVCKRDRYSGGGCKAGRCMCWNKCVHVPAGGATPPPPPLDDIAPPHDDQFNDAPENFDRSGGGD
ncbi:hypothetical protein CASFOL_026783 [Castilleja foliolosa]|uniref:Defensin-like protein n=1 Tax=Castilleja foliolosa TaxID=1961234 RepID=A0ABD3CKT2_9LAMI